MAYKLAEEDKICGVIYPTYEGFSPIPKATCEMLESKCDELDIEITCGGKKKEDATNTVDEDTHTNKVLDNNLLENLPTTEIGDTTGNTVKLPDESSIEDFKKVNKALLEGKLGKGYTVDITVDEPNKVGEHYTGETINIEVTTPSGKKIKKVSPQTFITKRVDESSSETPNDNNTSDIHKGVTDLFNFVTLDTFFVTRGDPYRAMYLKEDTENGLNAHLMDILPSSNYLTYKDLFTIDDIYIKDKLDSEHEPKNVTLVVNITLASGEKKTLELPKEVLYIDGENIRPVLNPNIPLSKSEAPDTSDLEIHELTDNHEFYYGNITPTSDGNIGALVGNNGKPITQEELDKQSEVFSEELKKVLGDRVTKVKVNIVQLLNVGDHIGGNRTEFHSAFRLDIDLVKRNGSTMKLYELATTSVVETL